MDVPGAQLQFITLGVFNKENRPTFADLAPGVLAHFPIEEPHICDNLP
jgi:hypothetical protein